MMPLNDIAINLKAGEYSKIIETGSDYYILMKTEDQLSPVDRELN